MSNNGVLIDALGQPCPIPVVKARAAIASLPAGGGRVEVLVDNTAACGNLAKMAVGFGHACEVRERADGSHLVVITVAGKESGDAAEPEDKTVAETAAVPAAQAVPSAAGAGLVAVLGSDSMGRGSEELGRILLKGFVFSLSQLPVPPAAVLFFNSGVRLALDGANTLDDLRALADRGTHLLVCGTCADYYQCRDKLAVGRIVTMYDIVTAMAGAARVVSV